MTKKTKLYKKYFLRLCKEYKMLYMLRNPIIDKDYTTKLVMSGVNWLANIDEKELKQNSILVVSSMNVVIKSFLTLSAIEIANLFPPRKVYDGEKYQCKDYFSAIENISKYQQDGFHNKEERLECFLEDLTNVLIWKFLLIKIKLAPYIELYIQLKRQSAQRQRIRKHFKDFIVLKPHGWDIVK